MADPPARARAVDDAELMARVAAGDRGALAEIYTRHAGWLTVRLERRCHSTESVDTAVQDTFLDVWRNASRYSSHGQVGAWIWTIGIRRLIDVMRKQAPPEPTDHVATLAEVVTEEIPLALRHTALGRAIAELDPQLQDVIVATALDGLSNREAGHLLGIPTGTVKSRLSRARRALEEIEP